MSRNEDDLFGFISDGQDPQINGNVQPSDSISELTNRGPADPETRPTSTPTPTPTSAITSFNISVNAPRFGGTVGGDSLFPVRPFQVTRGGGINFDITSGERFSIYAIPDNGYNFIGWLENGNLLFSESSLTIVADRNYNLTAVFDRPEEEPTPTESDEPTETEEEDSDQPSTEFEISLISGTIYRNQSDRGQVFIITSRGDVIGGNDAGARIPAGESITVRAEPRPGFTFNSWLFQENARTWSRLAEQSFEVTGNLSIRAQFVTEIQPPDEPPPVSEPVPEPPPPEPPPPPPTPTPTPTPVIQWRGCIDGNLYTGNPPTGYVRRVFGGPGGGVCWEPATVIGFNPNINNIRFTYQRGTSQFPKPFEFEVSNPSSVVSYKITFETNTRLFEVSPRQVTIGPRATSQKINISVNKQNIEEFGDGLTNFDLKVRLEEI